MKPRITYLTLSIFVCISFVGCDKHGTTENRPTPEWTFYAPAFDKVPSIDNMRIYEAAPRVFAKENSLDAITNRLDAIASLNVNVLWVMPVYIMASEGTPQPYGSPYSIKSFYGVDTEFGTLDDLRTLVEEAHKRDMAVIMDIPVNHTSWDNVWIEAYPEWYTRDAEGNIVSPSQGSSVYTNSAQLDWSPVNAAMRQEFIKILKQWIATANIDGYRCDSADWMPHDFWQEAIDELRDFQPGRDIIMLAEGTAVGNLEAGFDMNYGWTFCDVLERLYAGSSTVASLYTAHTDEFNNISGIVPAKTKMRFSTNHDRTSSASPVSRYGNLRGSMSAFVLAMTMGGVPMIYSSQEIGWPDRISIFKRDATVVDWSLNPDVFGEYQKLLALHAASEVLRKGDITTYLNSDIVAFTKTLSGAEIFVAVNVRNQAKSLNIPAALQGGNFKNLMTQANITLSSTLALGAYEYLILEKFR